MRRRTDAPSGAVEQRSPRSIIALVRPAPWLVAVSIFIITALLFSRTFQNDFVGYDDPKYVTANRNVQSGITAESLSWAFNVGYFSSWHPLTWLSHMIDVRLFGTRASGHHATSALLFAMSASVLFLTLHLATGSTWRSAATAALFAWHPLRVQSVAWVSERKDVLAILFGLLALYAYTWYARKPSVGRYLAVVAAATLSLMSKAMWITLPAVLILWDIWPLRRWSRRDANRLILEKLPLLALSIGAGVLTYLAQSRGGAVTAGAIYTADLRFPNAIVGYVRYLLQFIWPDQLAVYYPYPAGGWPLATVIMCGALLATVTVVTGILFRFKPYLLIGWLWYLVMMLPMIGMVQVGSQSIADRYTLAPMIGIAFAIVWLANDVLPSNVALRATIACAVLAALAARTWVEIGHWRDTFTLFTRAHEVTGGSFISHGFLGREYARRGDDELAAGHYAEALRLNPQYAEVHYNLGNLLLRRKDLDGAIESFTRATQIKPDLLEAHMNLGSVLAAQHKYEAAIDAFQRVLKLDPHNEMARRNLAAAEAAQRAPSR